MRLSWNAVVAGTAVVGLLATLATAPGARSASAQPTPPNRFFGTVTVDGRPASAGTTVTARVGANTCGTGTVAVAGNAATYVVDVASAPAQPGCGTDGAEVSFAVGGAPAAQTGTFQTGAFTQLNLAVAQATATPSPTPAATRTVTATPAATRTATAAPSPTMPVRTPTALPATPAAQRPGPAPARPALPRTGAAVQAERGSSAGLALFGVPLVVLALGVGGLAGRRRGR